MSHVLLRSMVCVLLASPFILAIAYLMAIFDSACWKFRRKHAYRPGPR